MLSPRSPTVKELDTLEALIGHGRSLAGTVVQGLDLRGDEVGLSALDVEAAVFLGCRLANGAAADLVRRGALVFPRLTGLPYDPYRRKLYSPAELLEDSGGETLDLRIYNHYVAGGGRAPQILEALAQRIHDHAIDDAVGELIGESDAERLDRRIVGVMGGHGTKRDDPWFRATARLSRELGARGFTVVTGGGPGTMEAANLGAFAAGAPGEELERALAGLATAPGVEHPDYERRALEARAALGDGSLSLAVPTWFYGHEPSNLFSTHIAKYFSNSIREDSLLAMALHGIVFTPGSAGTVQEIWQDNAQNHYATFGYRSPMVFLGTQRWCREGASMFDVLRAEAGDHRDLLAISDDPGEIVDFIEAHPPVPGA